MGAGTTEHLAASEWAERSRDLASQGWELVDLCGLDRIGLGAAAGERFDVVVQLLHPGRKQRSMLHILAAGDPPTVPSVTPVWPGADYFEREAFDMFGIHFDGHPNHTRILMPDDWEGHPLRKDYGVGKVTVEFLPQPFLQTDAPGQAPDSEAARREVDELGQAREADGRET